MRSTAFRIGSNGDGCKACGSANKAGSSEISHGTGRFRGSGQSAVGDRTPRRQGGTAVATPPGRASQADTLPKGDSFPTFSATVRKPMDFGETCGPRRGLPGSSRRSSEFPTTRDMCPACSNGFNGRRRCRVIRALQRDEKEIQHWQQVVWPELKRRASPERRTLVFTDEAGFYLLPGVVKTYAPKAKSPVISEWQTPRSSRRDGGP